LKEVISIWFDQNLLREWIYQMRTEYDRRQNYTEDGRQTEVRSEVFIYVVYLQ
jgi:hypothetical protein